MKYSTSIIIIFFSLIVNFGCREQYSPEPTENITYLVVDGMITNDEGPYEVKISQSTCLNKPKFIPYENCEVELIDNSNNSEFLEEVEPGYYVTSKGGITGEIGNSYKLSITTPDGSVYESDYEALIQPVGIDSVYAEIEYLPLEDELNPELPGYQFYIDTKMASSDSSYFLWHLTETFKYNSDYLIYGITTMNGLEEFYPRDAYYTCYKTQQVKQIFTGTTEGLTENKLRKKPLHFVGTETKRILYRYSILVKQYTISNEAHNYWEDVYELIDNQSFLSTQQPHQLQGNVYNIENQNELVLGYFTVASVTERRDFFDPPDVKVLYKKCMYQKGYPPYRGFSLFVGKEDGTWIYAGQECFDCRKNGGTLEKPEFWDEEYEY